VYGPVCTVVWQGSAGDRRPYADLTAKGLPIPCHLVVVVAGACLATSAAPMSAPWHRRLPLARSLMRQPTRVAQTLV